MARTQEQNGTDRIIGELEATTKFMKESLVENKQELRQVRNAIESINSTLLQLSNLENKLQSYETQTTKIQIKIEGQQEDILFLKDAIQDIQERMETQKKLKQLMVGAMFTIAANVVVLLINIFYKTLIARYLGL